MRKLFWIMAALFVALAVIVATLPARAVLQRVLPATGPVQLEDVSGTIWKGHAGRVLYQSVDQGRLNWHVDPWPLLSGSIEVAYALQGDELAGTGRAVKRGELLTLDGAKFTVPARRLAPLLDVPALEFTGSIEVTMDQLQLLGRVPMALKGDALWRDAGVTGAEQARFGNISAHFGPLPGGSFGGEIEDDGGPLEAVGDFRTTLLGYEALVHLQARDGNPQVTRALRHIGQVQEDGSVMYEVRGGLSGASR